MEKEGEQIKIVLMGDAESGKTCMIHSYINDSFRNEYTPTVFDNYKCQITIGNTRYPVVIW